MNEWRKGENSRSLVLQYGISGNQKKKCCKECINFKNLDDKLNFYSLTMTTF